MGRRRTHAPLTVALNGRAVGLLLKAPNGAVEFRYDPGWLAWEHALPVSLSMPLSRRPFAGDSVVAVLDNLRPDNEAIRRRVAERTGAAGQDAYSLLATIGRDCVGALQFLPGDQEPSPPGPIDGDPIDGDPIDGDPIDDDAIASLLRDLDRAPLGLGDDQEFRISIAGAQEKTALLHFQGIWLRPHGPTATTHILKPQIGRMKSGIDLSQSVENEHACLRFLATLGLPVATTAIVDFAGMRTLVVERFDRQWTADSRLLRRPQEDCCQALGVAPTRKYEAEGGPGIRAILDLLRASDRPAEDRQTFLKAQLAFWLLGATDGHAKNFSLFLGPAGRFRLTPLYDIMSAQPNVDRGEIRLHQMKLAMAVGGNRHYAIREVTLHHFIQTASQAGLPKGAVETATANLRSRLPAALEAIAAVPELDQALKDSLIGGVETRLRALTA